MRTVLLTVLAAFRSGSGFRDVGTGSRSPSALEDPDRTAHGYRISPRVQATSDLGRIRQQWEFARRGGGPVPGAVAGL